MLRRMRRRRRSPAVNQGDSTFKRAWKKEGGLRPGRGRTAVCLVQAQKHLPDWKFSNGVLSFTAGLEWADYIPVAK